LNETTFDADIQDTLAACKKTELWVAGVVICLDRGADLHMAQLMLLPLTFSCFSEIQIGFYLSCTAYLDSPGKRAVKRVCVCVLVYCCQGCIKRADITGELRTNC